MKPGKIVAILVAAGILGLAGYRIVGQIRKGKAPAADMAGKSKAVPIAVATVQRVDMESILELTGDVRGLNEARVFPKVPGKLMRRVKDVGDTVRKGETLVMVDRDEPALEFAPGEVTSPLDGVITRYFVDRGELVSPATPIAEVAEISPVKVLVRVGERELPRVRMGQSARFRVDAYPGQIFRGTVAQISEALGLGSRASDVEIHLMNPDKKLKPGMFARVELILDRHPHALAVPEESLLEVDGESFVYTVPDGMARRTRVEIGLRQSGRVEILKGLSGTEKVVTIGWQNLADGSVVDVVEEAEENQP
ncbi:MAG: efflux RND transporter periplasmic adaptor subunit [Nitrospirae bacterium]|nr:efflux RND transporter periplasmic adaptor subunit [Nitrospirota bacterium]